MPRAGEKCSSTNFIVINTNDRMTQMWVLYIVALIHIFKVIKFLNPLDAKLFFAKLL